MERGRKLGWEVLCAPIPELVRKNLKRRPWRQHPHWLKSEFQWQVSIAQKDVAQALTFGSSSLLPEGWALSECVLQEIASGDFRKILRVSEMLKDYSSICSTFNKCVECLPHAWPCTESQWCVCASLEASSTLLWWLGCLNSIQSKQYVDCLKGQRSKYIQ